MSELADLLADQKKEVTDGQMGELGDCVTKLLNAQESVRIAAEKLKQLTQIERNISEIEIPGLMENLGFESITLNNGMKVSVKESPQIGIPAAKRPVAYKWLDDNGHGDLIKIALTAQFARGERQQADDAFNLLVDNGVNPNQTESVHAGTLKAWAREELAQGTNLPEDLFNVHIVKQTTVK